MDNIRGAILMVLAMLGFAIEDALIKTMAGQMPVGQVVIILGIGGATFFAIAAQVYGDALWSPALHTPAMVIRNTAEVVGAVGFVSAIALTPLSTASAILQATPLVVTLGAALFLGETVGRRRWLAIGIGLVGVLLIIRPGTDGFDAKSLFAVVGVLGLAARDLATRNIPSETSSRVIAFYAFFFAIIAGVILLAFGVTGRSWVRPDTADSLRLALAILVGIAAYYAIVGATRIGEMSMIAPFRYSRLVFALLLGMMIFGERPDRLTILGAAVIVGSGFYTLWREQRLRQASKPESPAL